MAHSDDPSVVIDAVEIIVRRIVAALGARLQPVEIMLADVERLRDRVAAVEASTSGNLAAQCDQYLAGQLARFMTAVQVDGFEVGGGPIASDRPGETARV